MSVPAAQTGADALAVLLEEARTAVVLPWQPRTPTSVAVAQTGADTLAALLEEARTTVAHAHERGGSPDGRGRAGGAPGGGAHGNGGGRVDGERDLHMQRGSLSPDRYHGYHGFQAVVRDVGPDSGWPTLTKTNYIEWAAVMRVKL